MNFKDLLMLIPKILSKLPPLWLGTCFLVLTLLVCLAVKRIFF